MDKDSAQTSSTPKHAGGRPPKFETPEQLERAIDLYYESLEGDENHLDKPPTIAGLARALGFLDRQSIIDYKEKPEFTCIIKEARLRIEEHHEGRLSGANSTGSICWLNNHAGYVTRQEITGANGGPIETHELNQEERSARISELLAKANA